MSSEESGSLADQAAAWVPPWARPSAPTPSEETATPDEAAERPDEAPETLNEVPETPGEVPEAAAIVDVPAVEAPDADEPIAVDEPAVEPVVVEPAVDEPAVEPVVVEPAGVSAVDEPVVDEPAADPVVVEAAGVSAVDEPAVEPVVDEPAADPAVDEPADVSAVDEPVAEPVVDEPAADPAVDEPAAEAPSDIVEPNEGEALVESEPPTTSGDPLVEADEPAVDVPLADDAPETAAAPEPPAEEDSTADSPPPLEADLLTVPPTPDEPTDTAPPPLEDEPPADLAQHEPPQPDQAVLVDHPAPDTLAGVQENEQLLLDGTTPDEPVPELSEAELQGAVEAILLVVDEPTTEIMLAQILEQPTDRITAMLEKLVRDYTDSGRGFELRRVAGGWRLYTRPEYAAYVEKFVLDGQQVRLTQAALETLAVIAYKQPVSRSRISAIRGVNCDGVVRTLVTRGLIEECGSEPESGAYLYRTTTLFLEKLGLDGVDQLPPLAPFLPDDIDEIADAQR